MSVSPVGQSVILRGLGRIPRGYRWEYIIKIVKCGYVIAKGDLCVWRLQWKVRQTSRGAEISTRRKMGVSSGEGGTTHHRLPL